MLTLKWPWLLILRSTSPLGSFDPYNFCLKSFLMHYGWNIWVPKLKWDTLYIQDVPPLPDFLLKTYSWGCILEKGLFSTKHPPNDVPPITRDIKTRWSRFFLNIQIRVITRGHTYRASPIDSASAGTSRCNTSCGMANNKYCCSHILNFWGKILFQICCQQSAKPPDTNFKLLDKQKGGESIRVDFDPLWIWPKPVGKCFLMLKIDF